jgi:hypothetical protein
LQAPQKDCGRLNSFVENAFKRRTYGAVTDDNTFDVLGIALCVCCGVAHLRNADCAKKKPEIVSASTSAALGEPSQPRQYATRLHNLQQALTLSRAISKPRALSENSLSPENVF